jgi:hypothetical protein
MLLYLLLLHALLLLELLRRPPLRFQLFEALSLLGLPALEVLLRLRLLHLLPRRCGRDTVLLVVLCELGRHHLLAELALEEA